MCDDDPSKGAWCEIIRFGDTSGFGLIFSRSSETRTDFSIVLEVEMAALLTPDGSRGSKRASARVSKTLEYGCDPDCHCQTITQPDLKDTHSGCTGLRGKLGNLGQDYLGS